MWRQSTSVEIHYPFPIQIYKDHGDIGLCMNGLCIGNTYFARKTIHKETWRSPDDIALNEIDYICSSR